MSDMEGDDILPQDGAPSNQAPPTDSAAADPTTTKMEKVLSIEEAKAVTISLLAPWSQDQLQKREIQRLWPIIDSNLPRGTLQPSSHPSMKPPAAQQEGATGAERASGANASRKRPRTDQVPQQNTATTTTAPDITFPILEDGTLAKPSIPGVSSAAIDRLFTNIKQTCGECESCLSKATRQFNKAPTPGCPTLKAVKSWEAQFGGVSYTLAQELAEKLAKPLANSSHAMKNLPRLGHGIRCETCRACRKVMSNRYKCNFVNALLTNTVPGRFTPVLAEVRAAAAARAVEEEKNVPSSSAGAGGSGGPSTRISLQHYIEHMPGVNNTNELVEPQRNNPSNRSRINVDSDGETEDDIDDDEEILKWISWAPFLSHPEARQYTKLTTNTASINGTAGLSTAGSGLKSLSARQQVAVLSERLNLEPESLIDWICTARIVEEKEERDSLTTSKLEGVDAVQSNAPEDANGASGSGGAGSAPKVGIEKSKISSKEPLEPVYTECGHINGRNMFCCESCGTVRWDGPLGQLRTRIISALQSGILIGTAGRTAADIDTELAATVAARIAAEAGPGAEMLLQIDELMNEVYSEVQRVRAARSAAGGSRAAGGRSRKEEEEKQVKRRIASIARRTQMAQSVITLQNAVSRLVEEQTALGEVNQRAKKKQRREKETSRENENLVSIRSEENQKRMKEFLQLRSLLVEAKDFSFDWEAAAVGIEQGPATGREAATVATRTTTTMPSSSRRQRSGGTRGGASAITRPSFLGYSAFTQRIVNCLPTHQGNADADASIDVALKTTTRKPMAVVTGLASGYQALCELIFTSAPPLLSSSSTSTSSPSSSVFTSQGWTESMIVLLEKLLRDVEATKQLMLAAQIGGSGSLFRHVLWALLQRQQEKQRTENTAAAAAGTSVEAGGGGGGGGRRLSNSQPSQQPNPFLIPTQQSQPDAEYPLSQTLSQSQQQGRTTGAAGPEDVAGTSTLGKANNSEWASSIALLDELINGLEYPPIINSTSSTGTASVVEEERQNQYKMNVTSHITSATLQFLYGMTHSVLSTIAQKEARDRIPAHLVPFNKTILEYALFPDFPPLPPPPPPFLPEDHSHRRHMQTDPSVPNRFDIHDIVKPIPDSRQPVQAMVKGILPRRGKLPSTLGDQEREVQKQPPQARSGAFSVWGSNNLNVQGDAGGCSAAGDEIERGRQQQQQQQAVFAEVVKQCPADVQLVFSEAIKSGVRPEVVYKAALRYVETAALGKKKDG